MASTPEVPSSLGEGVLLVLQRSLLGFLLRGRSHAAPSESARIEPHRPPWSSPQGRRSPDPIPPAATVSCQARLLQSQRVGTRPSTWLQYARHRGRRRPVRKLPTCLAAPKTHFRTTGRFRQWRAEPALPSSLLQDGVSLPSDLPGRTTGKLLAQQPRATAGER